MARRRRGRPPRPDAGHRTSVRHLGDVDRAGLERAIDELGTDVVRAKGVIACRDVAHPLEVNVVGTRRRLRERPDLSPSAGDDCLVVIEL